MKQQLIRTAAIVGSFPILASTAMAANHREAPITALDHKADITDVFAFRSYNGDSPTAVPSVTLIMCVDPLLEPGNGPNYFPFDPDILYELKVDNDNDAIADVTFQVRFTNEANSLATVFTGFAGVLDGANASPRAPDTISGDATADMAVIPPRITGFTDAGFGLLQSYTVTMVGGTPAAPVSTPVTSGGPLYAVPANVGPRTMDYEALFAAGTYTGLTGGISSFAGTVDDPFWIDLGGAFDTLNLETGASGIPGVLTDAEDSSSANFAPDYVAGKSVNAIAIEVPLAMVQSAGATSNTIGVWCTTSRPRVTVRRSPSPSISSGTFRQIQRMGNPLINELIIGTGFKDTFSMDQPLFDGQYASMDPQTTGIPSFFLDPVLPRVANAAYNKLGIELPIPPVPRLDLLPLVNYTGPFAADPATEGSGGPVADLLRLRVDVPPTPASSANRLGFLFGDSAGFPNGRRLMDDVTDIALRVVVGGFLVADKTDAADGDFYTAGVHNRLGDGVNSNDAPYRTSFPYFASAPSGNPSLTPPPSAQ